MRSLILTLAPLLVCLLALPAGAASVNNYNPTEGFLANGLAPGKSLADFHLTASLPGIGLSPSIAYVVGVGHDWEVGAVSGPNLTGLGTPLAQTSLDTLSLYAHGPLATLRDNVLLGLVAGTNLPLHASVPLQVGAEGILEVDLPPLAIGLNSGYMRDFSSGADVLYENLNFNWTLGAFAPFVEIATNLYPGRSAPDYVVRGDLAYAINSHWTADANAAIFFPALGFGPSLGATYNF